MIPVKLSLRNFMCYKDDVAPLLLDGVHIACLSGDNGNGKSALLDALTWALWGESRAKSDDDLIHSGRSEMEVELEFLLGSDQYRVVRKRVKPKSTRSAGQTSVELHITDGEGGYRAITGNNVRETEKKIVDLLRMDYHTFVNSAFLVQGRADEFTTKTPSERKKVLADILGLSFYDELEDRARQKAREKDDEKKILANSISELEGEIEKRPSYEQELQEITAELYEIDGRVRLQESQILGLRETRKLLDVKKEQLLEIERQVERANRELQELRTEIAKRSQRVQQYQSVLSRQAAIEEGYGKLLVARKASEVLSQKLSQVVALNEQRNTLEKRIEEARVKLTTEREIILNALQRLEPKVQMIGKFETEVLEGQTRISQTYQKETQRESLREEGQTISNRIHLLRTSNDDFKKEMNILKDKLDLLVDSEAKCPLCETDLDHITRQNIEEKFRQEGKEKAALYRTNEVEIKELERRHGEINRKITEFDSQLSQEKAAVQRIIAVAEKNLEEARSAATEVEGKRKTLVNLNGVLEDAGFAKPEKEQLVIIMEKLRNLNYSPEEHELVRRTLSESALFEGLHNELETSRRFVGQEQEALARDEKSTERRMADVTEGAKRQEDLRKDLSGLPQLQGQIIEAQAILEDLVRRQTYLKQREGGVRQKLDHCLYLEKQKAARVVSMQKAVEEKSIFDELALAFGKRGIQAMIIEAAVPEIQDEANSLLARMTDNRMHVLIDTQRDTKKGDTIETLDIKIADELGTRSYEMFSGGEAFRANFAIRVALSKLLARRAGARLQTLIIDEGFGTQDTVGREKLVEAINSIAGEFERIIVITHIQELKDLFPVRIEVTKGAEGSNIWMN